MRFSVIVVPGFGFRTAVSIFHFPALLSV